MSADEPSLRDAIIAALPNLLRESNARLGEALRAEMADILLAGPLAEVRRQAAIGAWVEQHGDVTEGAFVYRTAALAAGAPVLRGPDMTPWK